MHAHELLNLPAEGFTVEQLRYNYKALARQLHPDKRPPGMTTQQATEAFQVLTAAFKQLQQEAEGRVPERTFDELRRRARADLSLVEEAQPRPPAMAAADRFDVTRFNQVFDRHRVEDPVVAGGYGGWMAQQDPEEATRLALQQRRAAKERQLSRWVEPTPTALTARRTVAFSELGATGPADDYGCNDTASGARHIRFSDYRLAHTTTAKLVDDEDFEAAEAARRGLGSVDALLKHRAALSHRMSRDDRRRYDRAARDLELAEARRRAALTEHDQRMESAHSLASRLLM